MSSPGQVSAPDAPIIYKNVDDSEGSTESAFYERDTIDPDASVEFTLDDDDLGLRPPVFTNGIDEQVGGHFPSIQTPCKKPMLTYGSVHVPHAGINAKRTHWEPSFTFIGLPYVFARKNPKDRHCCGTMFRVMSVCARELGCSSWLPYILTRGWQCKCKQAEKRCEIQFKRVEEMPTDPGAAARALAHKNFHALIAALCLRLRDPRCQNAYDKSLPLKFMEQASFIAKINTLSQDLLKACVTTKRLFLPFVKHRHGDNLCWTEATCESCHSRTVLRVFLADLALLLSPGRDELQDGSIQQDLMEDHLDSMSTEVSRRASALRHDDKI